MAELAAVEIAEAVAEDTDEEQDLSILYRSK